MAKWSLVVGSLCRSHAKLMPMSSRLFLPSFPSFPVPRLLSQRLSVTSAAALTRDMYGRQLL